MLSIGPGSTCDVCLDAFGHDHKAPCSIQCGHVFCVNCLTRIGATCPLCRNHFDQRAIVKLHIDLDSMGSPKSLVRASCPTSAEQEARKLQDAIASIANEGTTESKLRQLIGEATTFLAAQPKEMFSDLRVTHRMLAYLCETKTILRDQTTELSKLTQERDELKAHIEHLGSKRRDEKDTALAVEMSLRDHCTRAHAAYETMVERYNFVVQEWMRLNEEVRRIRLPDGSYLHEPDTRIPVVDVRFASDAKSSLSAHSSSHEHHQRKLEEAAVADPDSFLISPLPEFTGRGLASTSMDLFSLPDVIDDLKKKPVRNIYKPAPVCNSQGHPVSCQCAEVPSFPELPHPASDVAQASTSRGRSASFIERPNASEVPSSPSPIFIAPEVHSSFSDRDNFGRLQRSGSRSSRPSSRSRPSSQASTRQPSPSRRSASNMQAHSRIPSPSEDVPFPSSSNMNMSLPQLPQTKGINRLHSLLQDTNGLSSSLPNMHSHFPASISREPISFHERRRSPSRSRSRSSSGHRTAVPSTATATPPTHRTPSYPSAHAVYPGHSGQSQSIPSPPSPPLASSASFPQQSRSAHSENAPVEPPPTSHAPPLFHPPMAISTASSAAIALEKAKRDRQKAERKAEQEERQRSEKDNERLDRERERDRDRPRGVEDKRPRERQTSSTSYPPTLSYREPTSNYTSTSGSSPHPGSSPYPPQRTSSHGLNRSSTLKDSHNAYKNTTKAMPVLGATRV